MDTMEEGDGDRSREGDADLDLASSFGSSSPAAMVWSAHDRFSASSLGSYSASAACGFEVAGTAVGSLGFAATTGVEVRGGVGLARVFFADGWRVTRLPLYSASFLVLREGQAPRVWPSSRQSKHMGARPLTVTRNENSPSRVMK